MDNSKILLTGAMGYLGKAYCCLLENVLTLGRGRENLIVCDLAEEIPKIECDIDLVIHCAGKAHVVPKTSKEAEEFKSVNVKGTKNLLKGLEQANRIPKAFVFISSVAVYGREEGEDIKENHPLQAKDPYGISKIEAENEIIVWGAKNNVKITILRLPLIVGPHPPGNLGKMMKAIKKGYYLRIGNGNAHRSMVGIDDVVKITIHASQIGGIYNLTDGNHPTFVDIERVVSDLYSKKIKNIPMLLAQIIAKCFDVIEKVVKKEMIFSSKKLNKITNSLTFSDKLARQELGWNPQSALVNLNKEI